MDELKQKYNAIYFIIQMKSPMQIVNWPQRTWPRYRNGAPLKYQLKKEKKEKDMQPN